MELCHSDTVFLSFPSRIVRAARAELFVSYYPPEATQLFGLQAHFYSSSIFKQSLQVDGCRSMHKGLDTDQLHFVKTNRRIPGSPLSRQAH